MIETTHGPHPTRVEVSLAPNSPIRIFTVDPADGYIQVEETEARTLLVHMMNRENCTTAVQGFAAGCWQGFALLDYVDF